MKPIIEVWGVGKKFRIHDHREPYLSLRDLIVHWLKGGWREKMQDFWALRDVSFTVAPGESIGIIGRNGAGKSTLLKILSRITMPTEGRAYVRGRVASLLEVGTGFHPELTGRENIFFNGSILGMTRREVKQKFDEIVDFAGVERFIDTPLKHYSSGMQLRLAFAVAAFLEAEILLIDEILAVGDVEFQKKCLGKMEEVTQNQGRTILFVSHNVAAVKSLCQKALWLDKGKVVEFNLAHKVIDKYISTSANFENKYVRPKTVEHKNMYIKEIAFLNSKYIPTGEIFHDEPGILSILIAVVDKMEYAKVGVGLNNKYNNRVFSVYKAIDLDLVDSKNEIRYFMKLPSGLLAPNRYSFSVALLTYNNHLIDVLDNVIQIKVVDNGSPLQEMEGLDYGDILVDCKWEVVQEKNFYGSRY